jgi:hypothetical protein
MTRYPIYIISKGRWELRHTVRALEAIGAAFRVVIEPQEFEQYSAVIDSKKLIILPFSNLGQGSIPARNFVWQHSIDEGHQRHWILDDNIRRFYRLHENKKYAVTTTATFEALEDFVDRYENVPMAGMNYELLIMAKNKVKPITWNTRIYSCILLSNHNPLWWRGRYNEDTDLSLRYLKDKQCTALFNAFLCEKIATMTLKGGNTDELYKQDAQFDGRLEMARHLQQQHPDVCRVSRKWGRWQHHVDYRPFKDNVLVRKRDIQIPAGSDNRGMKLVNKHLDINQEQG